MFQPRVSFRDVLTADPEDGEGCVGVCGCFGCSCAGFWHCVGSRSVATDCFGCWEGNLSNTRTEQYGGGMSKETTDS